jgi:hypothetical protein
MENGIQQNGSLNDMDDRAIIKAAWADLQTRIHESFWEHRRGINWGYYGKLEDSVVGPADNPQPVEIVRFRAVQVDSHDDSCRKFVITGEYGNAKIGLHIVSYPT